MVDDAKIHYQERKARIENHVENRGNEHQRVIHNGQAENNGLVNSKERGDDTELADGADLLRTAPQGEQRQGKGCPVAADGNEIPHKGRGDRAR